MQETTGSNVEVRSARDVMKDYWLFSLAVTIAYTGAIVAILSTFIGIVRSEIVHPLTLIEVITAGAVFLRALSDPKVRRGFSAYNSQIRAFRRATPWRRRFFDPDWGIWARRYGSAPFRILRILAMVEVILATLAQHTQFDDIVFLAFATFFLTATVNVLYIALTTEPI